MTTPDEERVAKEKMAQKHRDELRAEEYKSLSEAIAATINRTNDAVARLQKVEKQLNISSKTESPDAVRYYDVILSESLQNLVAAFTEKFFEHRDPVISYITSAIVNILLGTRELVVFAGLCKKPDQNNFTSLLSPLLSSISEIQTLSSKHSASPSAIFYTAIAEGAQALAWISSQTPLLHVTNIRNNFSQYKTNTALTTFEGPISAFLSLLSRIEGYLEITHKQGLSWKGNAELPSQLHWNFQGIQLFPSVVAGQTSKVSKICESLSGGREEVVEPVDQRVLVLNSQDGILSIKGSNIPLISIENCSFTTVKILSEAACLDISNSQYVRVECSKLISGINIERCKGCILELSNTINYDKINVAACIDVTVLQNGTEDPICTITSISKTKIRADGTLVVSHINETKKETV